MAVILRDGRLTLTGYVGESSIVFDGQVWFDGFTHAEVVAALGEIDDAADLTVHINSGGGYVSEGTAIRSVLAERSGRTDVVVEGVAASAASVIAMAGETVTMAPDAIMMIHDPARPTFGTVADHERSIRELNAFAAAVARVYSGKSGQTVEACRALMAAETWFEADAAIEAGFADRVLGDGGAVAAAFPYHLYARAPKALAATARAEGWRMPFAALPRSAAAAAPTAKKETQMADTPKAAGTPAPAAPTAATAVQVATAAATPEATPAAPPTTTAPVAAAAPDDRVRIKAILDHPEAKGREPLARHFALETDMTAEAAGAALAAAPKSAPSLSARMSSAATATGIATADGDLPRQAAAGWKTIAASINNRNERHAK